MTTDGKVTFEREKTDVSLRLERDRIDRALLERQAALEFDACEVVHERDNADALLSAARERADRLYEISRHEPPDLAIVEARVIEDQTLSGERAEADLVLRREREMSRLLLRLIPIEREKTDRNLVSERVRADDIVANRDDFLGIVSHDLRNLLCGVVMSASMLSDHTANSACAAEGTPGQKGQNKTTVELDNILNCASRMNRLIGDLNDVVSIDAGRLAVVPALCNLGTLIREAGDFFRGTATSCGTLFEVVLPDRPLLAFFDQGRVLQVLTNLIANAIKFSERGGEVTVRAEQQADQLCITVSDRGKGIPSELREAIFTRFAQGANSDRRGYGLGLYISRCIVKAHGGRIWVEARAGGGSTFCFTLPTGASEGESTDGLTSADAQTQAPAGAVS